MGLAKIAAYIFIIIAVAAVAIFIMGQFEQTRFVYDAVVGCITSAKDWVTSSTANLGVTIASLGGLATLGGVAANAVSGLKSKLSEVTAQKDAIADQISSVTAQKDKIVEQAKSYESKIADYEKQLKDAGIDAATVTQMKTELANTQNTLFDVQQQKASLQNELSDLKNQYKKATAQLEVLRPKIE